MEYTACMELLAPDVMLVPTYTFRSPEAGRRVYDLLLPIAREYARRMDFRAFPMRAAEEARESGAGSGGDSGWASEVVRP